MKILLAAAALAFSVACLHAEVRAGRYDLTEVRDATTLESRVIEDWHPWSRDKGVRQKLIEINVCEWWPGQKVRLPVTLVAPVSGGPCRNVIVANSGVASRAAAPTGSMLRLLKEHGVGLVYIGMSTIDAMEPAGKLDVGMKEHFLKSKDARHTPAWIWGMSDMRALTAAMTEKEVFAPGKVMATGGSKRGVGAAAAVIADDRFTAMMPVVAPLIDPPGGPYVQGMQSPEIVRANEQFLADLEAGKIAEAPATARDALLSREKVRAHERITIEEARGAGWSEEEMKAACTLAWEVCRTPNYLPALQRRGVEIFYNEGSNDQVSPGLLEFAKRFPNFPFHIYVVPGGQHGGSKDTGFLKSVASLPEVDENLYAFARHHFFKDRRMGAPPKLRLKVYSYTSTIRVSFDDLRFDPRKSEVWWSVDRHPDYTFAMEYDTWQSAPLEMRGKGMFAEIPVPKSAKTVDIITVHQQTENGSTLTISSPPMRVDLRTP